LSGNLALFLIQPALSLPSRTVHNREPDSDQIAERVQAKANKAGTGKAKVISNKGDGVAQQFQLRLGKNTTVPLTLGFTKSNELFVGRLAMVGFAAAVIGEVVSGKG
jgi:hypothetical protein